MAKTYDKIATTTLTSTSTTVIFSLIPNTYTDLILVGKATQSSAGAASFGMKFNSDSGSNYSYQRLYYNGTSAPGAELTGTSAFGFAGIMDGGSIDDGVTIEFQIYDYANTTTYKSSFCRTGNSTSSMYMSAYSHVWRNTSAINSITIETNTSMVVGSNFTLYGIKAA